MTTEFFPKQTVKLKPTAPRRLLSRFEKLVFHIEGTPLDWSYGSDPQRGLATGKPAVLCRSGTWFGWIGTEFLEHT